jgi:hypothetical protein
MPSSVQVITDELEYHRDIEKYLKEEDMDKVGTHYKNIAIIGCQSSGKSTLLNILFDTNFEELNQKDRGMAQTTKGIWVARNSDRDVLVFDIEGSDSKERGDERLTFEQTTSLFALAIADVLLINLWTTDVGRYAASNYGLLKVIFEVNLKLFAQNQSQKKLIFVLRDFNAYENNKESIINLLETNINNIWKEIYKKEEFQNTSPHDFFEFEYIMMPHKSYQPKEFQEEGDKLRQRFKVDNAETVFPKVESTNIPIDGLPMYIENCWTCIREQKELNLPGEKQMVATYRCGEIKQEAIDKIQPILDELEKRAYDGIVDDYKYQCKELLKIAYKHYDESAKQYYQETYKSIKLELTNFLLERMYKSFVSQLKNLSLQADQKFSKGMRNAFSDDTVTDTFTQTCENLYDDVVNQFEQSANQLNMEDSDWHKAIDLYKRELSNNLVKIIEAERTKQKEKLFNFSHEAIIDELEEQITQPIKDLDDNFWGIITKRYKKVILEEEEKVKTILNDGFKTIEEEYDSFLKRLEEKIYTSSKKMIVKTTSDLNSHLLRKFNLVFKKTSEGKNRDWKKISEEQIHKHHAESVKQFDSYFDMFKRIEIPEYVSQEAPTMLGSFSSKKDQLLTADDITRIKDKFEDD